MYQKEYASTRPQMYDVKSRKLKAINIVKILSDFVGSKKLKDLKILDVGASSGIIDYHVSKYVGHLTGIDIDNGAINHAKSNYKRTNLRFKKDDALNLSFKDKTFDIVLCTHVYEHVEDVEKLFSEIYRVLKPNGICYLAAVNALWPIEAHYNLPFLSYLPKNIANIYLRIFTGKKNYYETLFTYWRLKSIVTNSHFVINDYTQAVLTHPNKFGFKHNRVYSIVTSVIKYFVPTFFWLLKK